VPTEEVPVVASPTTRGVVFIHSTPAALCPHIEWAVGGVLGVRVSLDWTAQPAAPRVLRAELSWQGRVGTAGEITSALRGWRHLRFEVTEEPTPGTEGERFACTPALGVFRGVIGPHGDLLVSENLLRAALDVAASGVTTVEAEVGRLLGAEWDAELEPFRRAGEGAPVRWLHQVG
jgi:hypothetical protein